jgi:hypothetical protein
MDGRMGRWMEERFDAWLSNRATDQVLSLHLPSRMIKSCFFWHFCFPTPFFFPITLLIASLGIFTSGPLNLHVPCKRSHRIPTTKQEQLFQVPVTKDGVEKSDGFQIQLI